MNEPVEEYSNDNGINWFHLMTNAHEFGYKWLKITQTSQFICTTRSIVCYDIIVNSNIRRWVNPFELEHMWNGFCSIQPSSFWLNEFHRRCVYFNFITMLNCDHIVNEQCASHIHTHWMNNSNNRLNLFTRQVSHSIFCVASQ